MNASIAAQAFNIAEPIPGYHTKERIGAGGYGEVWSAEAPGGIAKAIKIVYGYRDDQRATRELNALNRIKEVRHPFVLSLERIELIGGHLVIVTELASSSMKSLFDEHRQSGLTGIPRGELLEHLHDAADALDYICREHSLQHLDVKPENLLLVGGRIKVADFGLVKDLQDVSCSMISGLTPVYAAPELFDGRPNIHSDQYSLAIVYQEMLTGVPPFLGRTTAQLAAQHLHSRPRLDHLPASDQATIARALSKNPEQRFPSCREMVENLLEVTPNQHAHAPRNAVARGGYLAPMAAPAKTEHLSRNAFRGEGAATTDSVLNQAAEPIPAITDLPPLELKPEDVQYRPTIFVGIGGLAAKTLQSLQRRLVDRFGDMHAVPALQMLLLETDAETLKAVTEGDDSTTLANDSAVLLPLRQPANYRLESNNYLQWLNRRWIYNIPRSLQTQGFRPLGRLAFVDNIERVTEGIGRAIKSAVDPDSLAASARQTGLPFCEAAPRIFLVSSISGGTGSGMVLDVAYLTRKILRDLGFSEEGICGVLVHCTNRNPQGRDLAVANAYSFLRELHHYSDLHNVYPGDPGCGLPSFAPQDAPFSHTYVVHMGEDLEPKEFTAAVDQLSKYLYSNTVTSAAAFFDQCRRENAERSRSCAAPGGDAQQPTAALSVGPAGSVESPSFPAPSASADPSVRTFGLCQLGFSYDDVSAAAADDLCKALVTRWRGEAREESNDRPASLSDPTSLLASQIAAGLSEEEQRAEVARRAAAMGLDVGRIVDQLNATVAREMGDEPDAFLSHVLGQLLENYKSGRLFSSRWPPGELIVDTLDCLIRSQGTQDAHRVCLESVLETFLKELAATQGSTLREWIFSLVVSPRHRVEKAQRAADYMVEYLRELGRTAGEASQQRRRELCALKQTLLADKNDGRDWLRFRGFGSRRRLVPDRRLSQYFRLNIEELTLNGVCRLVGLILGHVAMLGDKLRNLAADLNRLEEEFHAMPPQVAGGQSLPTDRSELVARLVAALVGGRKAELVTEMEHDLEEALESVITTSENDISRVLPRVLRSAARATILRALEKLVLQEIAVSGKGKWQGPIFSLSNGLKSAIPRLSTCGGARRLLLLAPADLSPEQLVRQLGDKACAVASVVTGTDNGVLLCYEAEQLSLRRVAAAVLDQRFQNVEVADRLHTRIDVSWTPL